MQNLKNTPTDEPKFIELMPDTTENRTSLTQCLTAAIRWYACSEGHYDEDKQNVHCIVQLLEVVTDVKTA